MTPIYDSNYLISIVCQSTTILNDQCPSRKHSLLGGPTPRIHSLPTAVLEQPCYQIYPTGQPPVYTLRNSDRAQYTINILAQGPVG